MNNWGDYWIPLSFNDVRQYDDVYGALWAYSLFDYYSEHPEVMPSTMQLIESTQDVQLISRGHLTAVDGYQLNVNVTSGNINPNAFCKLSNGSYEMVIPGKKVLVKEIIYPGSKLNRLSDGLQDQSIPDPTPIIRKDFIQSFPNYPESYFNWTGAPYAKSLGITADDLDADSYAVSYSPSVTNSYLILNSEPSTPSVIIGQDAELDNTTGVNQTLTTSAYSQSVTTSETQTLTNGWKATWKTGINIPVAKSEISLEYSGSFSDAVSTSKTYTISAPSENIIVPPGCWAKASVVLSKVEIDSDYTAYGILDKHLQYTMSTPWKNMPASFKASALKAKSKYTKFGQSGLLPR